MLEGSRRVTHIVEHQRDQRTEAVPWKPAAVDIAIPKEGEVAIGHEEGRRVLCDIRAGHQQGQPWKQAEAALIARLLCAGEDALEHEVMIEKEAVAQEVHAAGAIDQHLPLIEAEADEHHRKDDPDAASLPDQVLRHRTHQQHAAQDAEHPVKEHRVAEEGDVQPAKRIVDRNPGQDIRHEKGLQIQGIREVAVDDADIVGIDHIHRRMQHIPEKKQPADERQKEESLPALPHPLSASIFCFSALVLHYGHRTQPFRISTGMPPGTFSSS